MGVIQDFWADGILTSDAARGVIKIIPRSGSLDFLKDWRPITMLMLMYKIISKILAARLKTFLPFLVDAQ